MRNRLNGSTNDRNQIPVGTVLVYRTSKGNRGKMQIVGYDPKFHMADYNLRVRFVTYGRDGSVLVRRNTFLIKGTWLYDLDRGTEIGTPKNRAADLWWEIVGAGQAYLDFENGPSFTIVS